MLRCSVHDQAGERSRSPSVMIVSNSHCIYKQAIYNLIPVCVDGEQCLIVFYGSVCFEWAIYFMIILFQNFLGSIVSVELTGGSINDLQPHDS